MPPSNGNIDVESIDFHAIAASANALSGIASSDPAFGGGFSQIYGNISGTGMGIDVAAGGGSTVVADITLFNQSHVTTFSGAGAQGRRDVH